MNQLDLHDDALLQASSWFVPFCSVSPLLCCSFVRVLPLLCQFSFSSGFGSCWIFSGTRGRLFVLLFSARQDALLFRAIVGEYFFFGITVSLYFRSTCV